MTSPKPECLTGAPLQKANNFRFLKMAARIDKEMGASWGGRDGKPIRI